MLYQIINKKDNSWQGWRWPFRGTFCNVKASNPLTEGVHLPRSHILLWESKTLVCYICQRPSLVPPSSLGVLRGVS